MPSPGCGPCSHLRTFDDGRLVESNIRERLLSEAGIFLGEPYFLLQDEIRQPRNHLAVLQAIGAGYRRFGDIARAVGLDRSHVGKYLNTLVRLKLVRRNVPVTVDKPEQSHQGHQVIADPYPKFNTKSPILPFFQGHPRRNPLIFRYPIR